VKNLISYLLLILLTTSSCDPKIADMQLDELQDKTEYTGGISVSVGQYMDQPVTNLTVNGENFSGDALTITDAGYYLIEFTYKQGGQPVDKSMRIVILDRERGIAEWGLKKWTPKEPAYRETADVISFIHPGFCPEGVSVPVVVLTNDTALYSDVDLRADLDEVPFNVKNGVGSALFIPGNQDPGILTVAGGVHEIHIPEPAGDEQVLSGALLDDLVLDEGAVVRVTGELTIPSNTTLTIRQGSFMTVDPGVNILNSGQILIEGTKDLPVAITCSDPGDHWGGFISSGANNSINASYTFICRSGYHDKDPYDYGHAQRQATFYMENGLLNLDRCFLTDHAGQVFYPVNSEVTISHCLVQRAKTGGQINQGNILISHSVFTDFPDDNSTYLDEDNDGLYLMGCDASIAHCVFAYCKDDALDSGGSGGGEITVRHTIFEAAFHEGAALSSGGSVLKQHTFTHCTFVNCGQGLELGYSSPEHHVLLDSCTLTLNNIGIRYGDNYVNQHAGHITVQNSYSIHNKDKDIWNMLRNNWQSDTVKMEFTNVYVSEATPLYPHLKIYD